MLPKTLRNTTRSARWTSLAVGAVCSPSPSSACAWERQICATVNKMRDQHVATQFVAHSLRPRLALHGARQALSREASRADWGLHDPVASYHDV